MKTKHKYILLFSVIAFVVAIDLITKALFGNIEYTKFIPGLIHFETNNGNYGAAWGILSGKKWLLILISIIGIGMMFVLDHMLKNKSRLFTIGLGMFIGGALGNLIDRIVLGYVRDFINFEFWKTFPTFNLADSFLCVAIVLICIHFIFNTNKDKNSGN